MKIDSHHHFWKYNPVEYDWISDEMKVIRRDFLPSDLRRESNLAGVDGVISVQARQTVEETKWLLKLAAANDFIKGVVGWLPLVSKTLTQDLEQFAAHQKLKGLRHVLQGEPDESYLLNPDFNAGIRAIKPFNLVYDLLFFERQLPAAIQFVDRHPSQLFVLDHIAKPRIKDGLQEPWNKNIRELARRENVYCKISGMVTEADWSAWTEAQLQPMSRQCWKPSGEPGDVWFRLAGLPNSFRILALVGNRGTVAGRAFYQRESALFQWNCQQDLPSQ